MSIYNVFIIVSAIVVAVQSSGNIQEHNISILPGGSINEDIVVDSVKHLMTVNVGDVHHLQSDCPSTINLHDFEKRKIAMKNIDSGECLVMDTKENLNATIDLLDKITRLKMTHNIEAEKLVKVYPTTYDRLLEEAGEHILEFSKGYKLLYGETIDYQEVTSSMHRCSGFCFICFIRKQAAVAGEAALSASIVDLIHERK